MSIEAMKQALEALGWTDEWRPQGLKEEAITSLRQAIAEAELPTQEELTKLYTAPKTNMQERNFCERCGKRLGKNDCDVHTCTPPLEPEPVQVSVLDFVEMAYDKEHLVGRPVMWAQWPTKEKV